MDVARISAVSPRQIDWRSLTARQIIKYEQQGVEVPSMYLQWAIDFRATIDLDDETTYEMAQNDTTQQIDPENSNENTLNNGVSTDDVTPQTEDDKKDPTASEYVNQMKSEGKSDYTIAKNLKGISEENKTLSNTSANVSSASQDSSSNSIEDLDSYMSDLMAQITEIKAEINTEKGKQSRSNSDIARLNQLQQQVKNLGQSGQGTLSQYSGVFDNFESTVIDQTSIIDSTQDYGLATVESAKPLVFFPHLSRFRKRVEKAGKDAISASDKALDSQTQALDSISNDARIANSYKLNITANTGVAAISNQNINADNNKDNQIQLGKNDNNNKIAKEEEQKDKTATNDGTDTTDRLNTNLDEILKRKIRKGENINA